MSVSERFAMWAPVATLVARRHRVLLHDFRGQLQSGKPREPWTMARHAEDLARLLDHLDMGPCHLVGTSYGGEVAMILAADRYTAFASSP